MCHPGVRGRAGDETARDPQTAFLHREHVEPLAFEPVPVRDHVVEPSADQAGGDRPDGDGSDVVAIAASSFPTSLRPQDGESCRCFAKENYDL